MRRRTVSAGADISDGLAIGGNTKVTKWPSRRGELYHLAIRHVNAKDAISVLIGFRMIGGGNNDQDQSPDSGGSDSEQNSGVGSGCGQGFPSGRRPRFEPFGPRARASEVRRRGP